MKCVDVVRLGAALCVPLLLSACANFTGPGPGPGPLPWPGPGSDPFFRSRQQLEALRPSLERFRLTYLEDVASCGKLAICSAGSKPNSGEELDGTTLDRTFTYAYQICYLRFECDRKEGDAVEECKRQCK